MVDKDFRATSLLAFGLSYVAGHSGLQGIFAVLERSPGGAVHISGRSAARDVASCRLQWPCAVSSSFM